MLIDRTAVAGSDTAVVRPAMRRPNLLLPTAGLTALALFVALYFADRALYARLIDLWSFHARPVPFLDLDGPLAWIRCWRQGQDVFLEATCDLLGRPMNYSPIVLRLPLPWVSPQSTFVYGIVFEVAFFASLAALPRPRAARDAMPPLLALFSPFCVFGLERGNFDLLIFVVLVGALLCLERQLAGRVLAYAAIVGAGLLKFYPWAALLLVLRERPLRFLLLSAVFVLCLGAFVVSFADELGRMSDNLPQVGPFGDGFGASQISNGLVIVTHGLHAPAGQGDRTDVLLGWSISAVLHAASLAGALLLARGSALRRAVAALSGREELCLTIGAVLMTGCFFTGASLGYRTVLFLFALPGLLAMARVSDRAWFAWLAWGAAVTGVGLMWVLPMQRLINRVFGQFWVPVWASPGPVWTPVPSLVFWLVREALWWGLMTFLLALVIRVVFESRALRDTWGWAATP